MNAFEVIKTAEKEIDKYMKNNPKYKKMREEKIRDYMVVRNGMIQMNLANTILKLSKNGS